MDVIRSRARSHHRLVQEIGLLDAAGHTFDHAALLTGDLSPVFFGSALTNFGVEPFLEEFLDLAPEPSPNRSRAAAQSRSCGTPVRRRSDG